MKRISWKKLGIEELQYRYGYDRNMAELQWNRMYRKGLRQVRKGADTKELNISRELYASTFYGGTQLFNVKVNDIRSDLQIATEFADTENIEKAFIEERFKNMATKYSDVAKLLDRYKKGKISYNTFKERIREFKDTNREYQKSGS